MSESDPIVLVIVGKHIGCVDPCEGIVLRILQKARGPNCQRRSEVIHEPEKVLLKLLGNCSLQEDLGDLPVAYLIQVTDRAEIILFNELVELLRPDDDGVR